MYVVVVWAQGQRSSYWTYYDSHKTCILSQNRYKKNFFKRKQNILFYFKSCSVDIIVKQAVGFIMVNISNFHIITEHFYKRTLEIGLEAEAGQHSKRRLFLTPNTAQPQRLDQFKQSIPKHSNLCRVHLKAQKFNNVGLGVSCIKKKTYIV